MKNIYLCRHGETAWTRSGQHTGSTDIALTEKGREQAEALKRRLQSTQFDAVFCSPMKRAYETCQIAGLKPVITSEIQEWDYGAYEGLDHEEILQKNPSWNLFVQGAPKGETPAAIAARADQFIEKLLKLDGNIAVFSHGHFLRVLCVRWLGLKVEMGSRFSLCVASISILGYEHEARALKLWNDTSHLECV